jgi:hypothetical protein
MHGQHGASRYDPDDQHPKTDTTQVHYTPVPGNAGWWFACCSD